MKKMFLTVAASLALCNYSFAQDDEDDYEANEEATEAVSEEDEEEETSQRAPVAEADDEEDEASAPAPAAASNARSSGAPSLGISMGITTDYDMLNIKYKLNSQMEITGILGLYHHGETTTESGSVSIDNGDNETMWAIGVGFDYYLPIQSALQTTAGIELIYADLGGTEKNWTEGGGVQMSEDNDASEFDINLMFGVHVEPVKNFVLSAKAGFGIARIASSTETTATATSMIPGMPGTSTSVTVDNSRWDFGLKAGVFATWYFL